MAYPPGTTFAGFTLARVLGTGGMGTVYLARHPRLPRNDALKLLRSDLSADPGFRARFEREADLAARLDHRNIVTVYDRGKTDEQLWIDMQYVDGIDASQALTEQPAAMTVERVLRIVSEVGAGLDFAHRHGLWHRDVKPANILLAARDDDEPERVLLTDFGVAKAVDEARQLTSTGNMLATLAYAAPEQIESRALDHRVDIYALGCVLYELLTGNVPFPEDTAYATMAAHLNKPPPRPTAGRSDLPAAIDDVVARAMAKSRDDRFASCRELALAAAVALAPNEVAPVPPVEPAPAPAPASAEPPTARPSGPVQLRPSGPVGSRPSGPVGSRPSGPVGPRPPYQIRVRRLGAGGEQELGPVYTDTLSLLETGALEELLGRAEFFALPAYLPAERPGTGDVRQEITVISAGRTHTVGYDLAGSRRPPELDEFVGRLERLASWRGPHTAARTPVPPQTPMPPPAPPLHPTQHTPHNPPPHAPQPLFGGGPPSVPQHTAAQPPSYPAAQPPGYPTPPPHGGPARGPWYSRPVAWAAMAAALVAIIVLTLVLTGGPEELPPPDSVEFEATASSVELTWDGVEGALRYEVSRDGDVLDTTRETTFVDDTVEGGQTYRYTVVALGADDAESPASARNVEVPAPGPAPPTPGGLLVTRVDGEVRVDWNEVADAATYDLFRGTVRVYSGAETDFVDPNPPGGTNQYTVLAVSSEGTPSERSPEASITLSDSWGSVAQIVAAFSNLLPSNPTENGYEDSTCGVGGAELDSVATGVAVCDYPSGVHLELRLFPDQAALDQRLAQVATVTVDPVEWFYMDTDGVRTVGGMVYESPSSDEAASRFATFVREDRALIGMFVTWPDHSESELFSDWWLDAPF